MKPIATFSIVGCDLEKQEWGVAVQSKFLAAAAVVSFAQADTGAVATQSYANMDYGPDGLALMAQGMTAQEVIEQLVGADDDPSGRQVGMVDQHGNAFAYTGPKCMDWAGHIVGDGFACQGNILIPGTVEAMAAEFERVRGTDGELSDWLVAALEAGQAAGGDSRGRQSAGVLVVRQNGGYGGRTDRYLDCRVDDDPYPIQKLKQIVNKHHVFFGEGDPANLIPIASVTADLQAILQKTGHLDLPPTGEFDDTTRAALRQLIGIENLEHRWNGTGDEIDKTIVEFLKLKFP
ncbi:MAG: DUF1028 domain-containing protein [Chloroflexota bacterium]